MYIHIARHAQSFGNVDRLLLGRTSDPILTTLGIEQSITLANRFTDCDIKTIISSPAIRACQTASIIAGTIKAKEVIVLPELLEVDIGPNLDGASMAFDDISIYKNMLSSWENFNLLSGFEFGEKLIDVLARIGKFFNYLDTINDGSPILVISHCTYIMVMMWFFCESDRYNTFEDCKPHHGSYYTVEYTKHAMKLWDIFTA